MPIKNFKYKIKKKDFDRYLLSKSKVLTTTILISILCVCIKNVTINYIVIVGKCIFQACAKKTDPNSSKFYPLVLYALLFVCVMRMCV